MPEGRIGRKGKSGPLFFSFFPFLLFLPSGTINPTSYPWKDFMNCWASQIRSGCSRHPFTLQRDAKGSAWPIPFHWNKVYTNNVINLYTKYGFLLFLFIKEVEEDARNSMCLIKLLRHFAACTNQKQSHLCWHCWSFTSQSRITDYYQVRVRNWCRLTAMTCLLREMSH